MSDIPDRFYQALLLINNILVREVTQDGLFQSLVATLQPLVNCDRCSLSIYNAENGTLEWFARAEGIAVTCMDDIPTPQRGPLAHKAIHAKSTFVAWDIKNFSSFDAIRSMHDAGLRSAIALPLMSRSQPIGALVVSFKRPLLRDDDTVLVAFLEKISVQVALAVDNMLAHAKLQKINTELKQRVGDLLYPEEASYSEPRFFYRCESMRTVMQQAQLLASSNVPVLIRGETGTGKEFIAHIIHRHSTRKSNNFVKVNCPALSSTLFESELFGHAKGAFTGANSQRVGRFEMADKGSIFLDEIGDLDKILQAKLLQVLQDSSFERVGESRSIRVNVRFISATNADLGALIQGGQFRSDLYYRLGTAIINIPPLRERVGELRALLQHLVGILTEDMQCLPITFSRSALHLLEEYHWPGNLRELSNMVKRLLILNYGGEIQPDMITPLLQQETHLPSVRDVPAAPLPSPPSVTCGYSLADTERQVLERVLTLTNGVISGKKGAATLLGLPRSTLLYKLKKHGIEINRYTHSVANLAAAFTSKAP
ncbi:sigma 54-interacting transcriptional regulator [Nitratidesulfovibrio sp. SRB-5]|uniref:sigma 54-interacting transcriptional regulator n=1 Tax=Nitratidesulfovibrio sp. SRB-5 TaxID=2872636 RepID=UPI00167E1016|nr:sigma 54-interacting transcriptional regulator [Nitratidesulfovibrio sp. SRB-5]MBZ2172955.1 sigma 54-interacting transcriptional regulator [Nitratidesulfovibrio sp. SRB-5]